MRALPLKRAIGLVTAVSACVYAIFIWRASSVIQGRRTFILFDDAMISMRYAHNLDHGHGLVFNAGGPAVEGFTNLGWVLWMALLQLLPIPARLAALPVSVTGAVLLLATIWFSARLANLLVPNSRYAPALAAVLTASSYALVFWSLQGMEVSVIAFIVTATAVAFIEWHQARQRRHLIYMAVLLALGVLIRPDAAILAVVTIAFVAIAAAPRERVRALLIVTTPFVVLMVGLSIFREIYFGGIVPNTYVLKVAKVPIDARLGRGLRAMVTELLRTGFGLAIAVAVIGWVKARRSVAYAYCACIIGAFCVYAIYVGGDAWETYRFPDRYISAALPLLFALTAAGYTTELERSERNRRTTAVFGVVLVAFFGLSFVPLPRIDALDATLAAGPVFISGLFFVALAIGTGGEHKRYPASAAFMVVALGSCIVLSGYPFDRWFRHNAEDVDTQQHRAAYGLVLEKDTKPGATIAVSAAGNAPFFAPNRTFFDELGKMDPVIAKMKPARVSFPPGHQKWNYEYTINTLRPDLVAEVFMPAAPAPGALEQWGYTQVEPGVYVKDGTNKVDVDALERDYSELPPE